MGAAASITACPTASTPAGAVQLAAGLEKIKDKHRRIRTDKLDRQLGTLGGGNHFIELCLDEADTVWVMLHSGSRGTGNLIGTYFIEKAREELARRVLGFHLPDKDLAFFMEGEPLFDDYVEAVSWAQDYARQNREAMMSRVLAEMRHRLPKFQLAAMAVNCHHNYVQKETHHGQELLVTRKGPSVPARVSWASFPAAWARAATSCVARATPTASTAAATVPAG